MDNYLLSVNINVAALLILAFFVVVENLSAGLYSCLIRSLEAPIGSLMFLDLAKPRGLCSEHGFTV